MICDRPFAGDVRTAGTCQETGCAEQICQTCWGPRGRRSCPAHLATRAFLGSASEAPSGAPEAKEGRVVRGGDPVAEVPASKPSEGPERFLLAAARFLDGFQGRMEAQPGIFASDGRLIVEVKNLARTRREEGPAPHESGAAPRRSLRPTEPISSVRRTLVSYTADLKGGALSTRHSRLKCEARLWDRVGWQSGDEPAQLPRLTNLLTRLAEESRQAGVHTVAGIFSFNGWSDEASELVAAARPSERFLSPDLSPALIGPEIGAVLWNSNDPVAADLGHYFKGGFEDEVASCKRRLNEILGESKVCLLSRLSEEEGFSPAAVRAAGQAMAKSGLIKLVTKGGAQVAVRS